MPWIKFVKQFLSFMLIIKKKYIISHITSTYVNMGFVDGPVHNSVMGQAKEALFYHSIFFLYPNRPKP